MKTYKVLAENIYAYSGESTLENRVNEYARQGYVVVSSQILSEDHWNTSSTPGQMPTQNFNHRILVIMEKDA